QYWQIRDPAAQVLDLPSRAEMRAGLREFAYSSVMDYSAKLFVSDVQGIGKYDRAAIKFGYGQLVESFAAPPDYQVHDILNYAPLADAVQEWTHYLQLPALFESAPGAGDGTLNM